MQRAAFQSMAGVQYGQRSCIAGAHGLQNCAGRVCRSSGIVSEGAVPGGRAYVMELCPAGAHNLRECARLVHMGYGSVLGVRAEVYGLCAASAHMLRNSVRQARMGS